MPMYAAQREGMAAKVEMEPAEDLVELDSVAEAVEMIPEAAARAEAAAWAATPAAARAAPEAPASESGSSPARPQ